MPKDDDGYILLWREILSSGTWLALTDAQRVCWVGLLLQVNWKSGKYVCRKCGKAIHVPAGGTAKTVRTLAKEADVARNTMFQTLVKLGRRRDIHKMETTRCHNIYVVDNWEKFQTPGTTLGQRWDNVGTTLGQIEERKERKEDLEGDVQLTLAPTEPQPKPSKPSRKRSAAKTVNQKGNEVLRWYHDEYLRLRGSKPVVTFGGSDLNTAKQVLSACDGDVGRVKELVNRYLEMSDDRYSAEGHPFSLFKFAAQRIIGGNVKKNQHGEQTEWI